MATMTETPQALEPGLHDGIPADQYHRLPGVSQSQLKILRDRSPAHLRHQLDNPPASSPAQILGAAIHDAVLLPDTFASMWASAGQCEANTKGGSGPRCKNAGIVRKGGKWFCGLSGHDPNPDGNPDDVRVLASGEHATALAVRDAIAEHPKARQLLIGYAEQSALWLDPDTGILCRGRFDLIGQKTGTLVDLKTTRCAAREPFSRDIFDYGYHGQAWFYLRGAQALGLDVDKFAFVAVEKEPPFAVAVYELTEAAIFDGGREMKPLMVAYAECEATGVWPGYNARREDDGSVLYQVEMIDLPTWAPNKINERLGEV